MRAVTEVPEAWEVWSRTDTEFAGDLFICLIIVPLIQCMLCCRSDGGCSFQPGFLLRLFFLNAHFPTISFSVSPIKFYFQSPHRFQY